MQFELDIGALAFNLKRLLVQDVDRIALLPA